MTIEVKVPQLPESVADATLVAWHKGQGDTVERDENLVDLETDKVVLEVPAPSPGTLAEIKVKEGAVVTSGDVLAILEAGEAAEAKEKTGKAGKEQEKKPDKAGKEEEKKPDKAEQKQEKKQTQKAAAEAEDDQGDRSGVEKLSPAVRRLVEEHDIDPESVRGTGRDGRITKSDVMSHLEEEREKPTDDEQQAPVPELDVGAIPSGRREEERVAMTRLRSRIAQRMVEAQQTAALLTTFNEVDLTEVKVLRTRYMEQFEKDHGVRLGFMSFFVKAAVEALRKFPVVNASVEDNDIVYRNYYDVGIAVSTERGLIVPILRDADQLSFADIEKTINDFAARAREGTISMDDLTGGTFTITNGGVFGSLVSTPIVNPPQSAILGMHAIQDRAVVVNKEIVIRPMMYLALTYDHRIIDGREAVQFLVSIKRSLEDPARVLLQI